MVNVKTLADFKRFLALPGATVQITRHDYVLRDKAKPGFLDPRTVAKLQTNAVQFSGGSWLYFKSAREYRFNGDTMTVDLGDDAKFERVMEYKLTIGGSNGTHSG
jgi:hypothetical protein